MIRMASLQEPEDSCFQNGPETLLGCLIHRFESVKFMDCNVCFYELVYVLSLY